MPRHDAFHNIHGSLRASCQRPRPRIRIRLYRRDNALEQLVRIQAEHEHRRAPAEAERAEKRQRQHDSPYADKIVLECKLCIPASADNTADGRKLVSRAEAGNAQHENKAARKRQRLRAERIE